MSATLDRSGNPLRLLLVHAHPDDETSTTGSTIARYADQGIAPTLVTCTRGERGENALATGDEIADRETAAEELGEIRAAELGKAASELGLSDVRFLGGRGAWWDSGMADALVPHPRRFSDGDLSLQVGQLVAVIREVRPQVLVTYDERGGYGHPDHIRAHEVSVAALDAAAAAAAYPAAGAPWRVSRLYAAVVPFSSLRRVGEVMARTMGSNPFVLPDGSPLPVEQMPFGTPDESVNVRVDGRDWLGAKSAAMRAHHSQSGVNAWFFELFDDPGRGFGVESFRLLRGDAMPTPPGEPHDDLFHGLRSS